MPALSEKQTNDHLKIGVDDGRAVSTQVISDLAVCMDLFHASIRIESSGRKIAGAVEVEQITTVHEYQLLHNRLLPVAICVF